MGTTPVVSIITPAYRVESIIHCAIESVLAQTMPDFEMLVVDDCSPDGTPAVVEAFARADRRIRLLPHSANKGPAGARNTALAAARARYLAFLDSDDMWLPQKLERHLAFVQESRAAISFTQYRRINREGKLISGIVPVPSTLDYHTLLRNTAIATSTVIVDRCVTGPFTMRDVYYDDFVCWLELMKRGHLAAGFQADLTRYRVLGGSWSRDKLKSAGHVWHIYRRVEQLPIQTAAWVFANYAVNAVRKYRL